MRKCVSKDKDQVHRTDTNDRGGTNWCFYQGSRD